MHMLNDGKSYKKLKRLKHIVKHCLINQMNAKKNAF